MKHLTTYKLFETISPSGASWTTQARKEEVYDVVDDCLQDLMDDGYLVSHVVSDGLFDEESSSHSLLEVEISKPHHYDEIMENFSFNDVKMYLNELISQLNGMDIDLKSVSYIMSGISGHLFRVSMDPVVGEISGDGHGNVSLLSIKSKGPKYGNVDISDEKNITELFIKFV
jgi:hypothetical protein